MTPAQRARERGLDAIPTSWLDPLLSGPNAIIGNPPYDCQDIERLLNAIRQRAALSRKREK